MADQTTGERLLTQVEFEQVQRKAAEDQLRAARAEIPKLRRQLGQSSGEE